MRKEASGNNQEAHFAAIIGTTGSGKTYELKRQLKSRKARRTLIWSPKERIDNYSALYPGSVICRTVQAVFDILSKAGRRGDFHIVFIPTLNQERDTAMFDIVCKLIMAVGNIVLIVDELHTVTTATHAPDGWRHINFMGRGFGVHVFGMSQRPASVDKAFMGSLSSVHVSRLPHPPDQKTMSVILGVPVAEVAALQGFQAIAKDMKTGKLTRKN